MTAGFPADRARQRLLETLPPTRYRRFLVFVMGPYKPRAGSDAPVFELLERFRDRLRDRGFNAFLAVDAAVPLAEVDAGSQSLAFARASNAVLFVIPLDGDNLGVGIEVGAVLEDCAERGADRILLLHEAGLSSAMLAAVGDRWDAAVASFADEADLDDRARLFLRDVMRRELAGDLDRPLDGSP